MRISRRRSSSSPFRPKRFGFEPLEIRRLLSGIAVQAPGFSTIPVATAVGFANPDLELASFSESPNGPPLSEYHAFINWGDGAVTAGAIGGDPTTGTYEVLGSHTYASTFQELSDTDIGIVIVDSSGNFVFVTDALTVYGEDLGVTGAEAFEALAGYPIGPPYADGIVDLGTFQDVADTNPADLSATVDWGDGTSDSPTFIALPGDVGTPGTPPQSGYRVFGTHTYATTGVDVIQIHVADKLGNSASSTTTAVNVPLLVTNQIPDPPALGQPIAAGQTLAVVQATSDDPASDYAVAFDWGDGSAPAGGTISPYVPPTIGDGGVTIAPSGTAFGVSAGSHTYSIPGTYTAKITVLDTRTGISAVETSLVTVPQATIAGAGSPLTALGGFPIGNDEEVADQTVVEPVTVATIQDSANPPASELSAAIDWGDGSSISGMFVGGSDGSYVVSAPGDHAYAAPGTYDVRVVVSDVDAGLSTTVSTTATIVPLLFRTLPYSFQTATGGTAFGGVLSASSDDPASAYSVSIDWGDGSAPTAGSIAPDQPRTPGPGIVDPIPLPPGTDFLVDGGHDYAMTGSYSVRITVLDTLSGSSTTATSQVTVIPEALSAKPYPAVAAVAGVNSGAVTLGEFSDDNDNTQAGEYSGTIDWGDGTPADPETFSVTDFPEGQVFLVAGSHTYARPGTYPITIAVSGAYGGEATLTNLADVSPAPPLTSAPLALPIVRPGVATALKLGTVSALDPTLKAGRLTAFVNYGDGSKVVKASVVKTGAGTFRIAGRHTYKAVGDHAIQATVIEKDGTSTTFNNSVAVAKVSKISARAIRE